MKRWLPLLCLLGGALPAAAQTNDGQVAVASAERRVEITLPKDQTALVRDQRAVHLDAGRSRLRFFEVPTAATLDLASLQLSVGKGVHVLDQRRDASTAETLNLSQFLGRKLTLLRQIGDTEKPVTGTLLRTNPLLLDTPDGVLLNPEGIWVLPKDGIPNSTNPTGTFLEWPVETPQAGDYNPELLYATTGLNWSASYSARLNQTQDRLAFRGWLSIANSTGAAYPGTRLHLADKENVRWDWPAPVTINREGATLLLADAEVPVERRLIYTNQQFGQPINIAYPNRSVSFQNSAANGLGTYLPLGPITLWSQDEDGHILLTKGTDDITRNGVKTDKWLTLAFGIDTNLRLSRDVKSRLLNPVTREWTITWTLEATDKGVPRKVSVYENLPFGATITESSQKPEAEEGWQRFDVQIEPKQKVEVKYVVTGKA
jgi:hypothetical protein